jgi:ribose 5-phosphate isomerase B
MNLELVIISDHVGFKLKKFVIENFANSNCNANFKFVDFGTNSEISVDYPDYAYKAASYIETNLENRLGIFICATGIGMSIAANRFPFLRAAYCDNTDLVKLARMHNNINVLCLGAKLISEVYAMQIIDVFLETKFLGIHHSKRIEKISTRDHYLSGKFDSNSINIFLKNKC